MRKGIPLGYAISQNSAKMGVPFQVYNLKHVISVVKCKFWEEQYILRRKSLVSTDTVCNDFVRQS